MYAWAVKRDIHGPRNCMVHLDSRETMIAGVGEKPNEYNLVAGAILRLDDVDWTPGK